MPMASRFPISQMSSPPNRPHHVRCVWTLPCASRQRLSLWPSFMPLGCWLRDACSIQRGCVACFVVLRRLSTRTAPSRRLRCTSKIRSSLQIFAAAKRQVRVAVAVLGLCGVFVCCLWVLSQFAFVSWAFVFVQPVVGATTLACKSRRTRKSMKRSTNSTWCVLDAVARGTSCTVFRDSRGGHDRLQAMEKAGKEVVHPKRRTKVRRCTDCRRYGHQKRDCVFGRRVQSQLNDGVLTIRRGIASKVQTSNKLSFSKLAKKVPLQLLSRCVLFAMCSVAASVRCLCPAR